MAEVIKFKCKACEKKISVRADYAGKKAKCPGCKQPLRVPSPRPKRSATGVPVAASGVKSSSSSSSSSASGISLADLAEMEANADAQLRELSPKAANRPSSIRIEGGKDCPGCGSSCKPNAVLCVHCGQNFDSGKKLKTKKDSKVSMAARSAASAVGREERGGGPDQFWKYASPAFILLMLGVVCFSGVGAGIDPDSSGKFGGMLHSMHETAGQVGGGLVFFGLSASLMGFWYCFKR